MPGYLEQTFISLIEASYENVCVLVCVTVCVHVHAIVYITSFVCMCDFVCFCPLSLCCFKNMQIQLLQFSM